LVLTRQGLPVLDSTSVSEAAKGGYVLSEDTGFESIIIATGSEVELAMNAKKALNEKGAKVRVVSMPSTDLFDAQNAEYKESVLPKNCMRRVAVEAGSTDGWYKYVGLEGKIIGMNGYGASAPYKVIFEKLGITVQNVVKAVESLS
jgi:transketolase